RRWPPSASAAAEPSRRGRRPPPGGSCDATRRRTAGPSRCPDSTWGRLRRREGGVGSDLVGDLVRDLDELAVDELTVRLLAVIDVLPHLEHYLVGPGRSVFVLVAEFGPGRRRGDDLAVAFDLPAEQQPPVVGDRAARDTAALQADLGAWRAFE